MSILLNTDTVDVWCVIRRQSQHLIWVSNGTMDMDLGDGREKLIELPRSQIRINRLGTITMPSTLAREKGLI